MSKKNLWATLFGSNKISSGSANKATERLKVAVSSNNSNQSNDSYLYDNHPDDSSVSKHSKHIEQMTQEILKVVDKYIEGINRDDVFITHRQEDKLNLLEMSIDLSNLNK